MEIVAENQPFLSDGLGLDQKCGLSELLTSYTN
jgi:hypothetical protein